MIKVTLSEDARHRLEDTCKTPSGLVERPQTAPKRTMRQHPSWQEGFARPWRALAGAYPVAAAPRVGVGIDNASWHTGALITAVLQAFPPLELYRLPSASPQRQGMERFWKVMRRRATHNRLLLTVAALKQALRNSVC